MKGKNYKIVSLYSFFPFQENLILDLKNKLLEIENENELSGLLIFASEGINGTICAEKNFQKKPKFYVFNVGQIQFFMEMSYSQLQIHLFNQTENFLKR